MQVPGISLESSYDRREWGALPSTLTVEALAIKAATGKVAGEGLRGLESLRCCPLVSHLWVPL